ncbi:hypothetical protein UY3_08054 [Chelonia mydas]|uniref:Uncharacterized protein n=1 Tax=Chelonia mydas TaxID=8469 RepID=M7BC86_CHEMY|nr:hypothetical protein UY3_08054 [Chelonia mydas]
MVLETADILEHWTVTLQLCEAEEAPRTCPEGGKRSLSLETQANFWFEERAGGSMDPALGSCRCNPGNFNEGMVKTVKILARKCGQIAEGILSSMQKREEKLFDNIHFLAGVYIDPQYWIRLTSREIPKAKKGLLDIARQLEKQNRLLHLNLAKEVEENETQQKESSTIEFAVSESSHPSEIAGCSQTSVSTLNLFERPSLRHLQPSQGNGDNSSTNSSEDDAFKKELDKQERRR